MRRDAVRKRFERCLVEKCAPTLAGIKVGSLFRYAAEAGENLYETVRESDGKLKEKGVRVRLIQEQSNVGLIYVFRPSLFMGLLSDQDVNSFLCSCGFDSCDNPDVYIERLQRRFRDPSRFPHEIGIFLGYPLHDVRGFIENNGKNCNLCGPWKVYASQAMAEKTFARYRNCLSIYRGTFEKSAGIVELPVAP